MEVRDTITEKPHIEFEACSARGIPGSNRPVAKTRPNKTNNKIAMNLPMVF
jgi:hypothetical protein